MNYAVIILAFVVLIATAYWFIAGRKYYTGPRTRARVVDGMIVRDDESAGSVGGDAEKGSPGLAPRIPHAEMKED